MQVLGGPGGPIPYLLFLQTVTEGDLFPGLFGGGSHVTDLSCRRPDDTQVWPPPKEGSSEKQKMLPPRVSSQGLPLQGATSTP